MSRYEQKQVRNEQKPVEIIKINVEMSRYEQEMQGVNHFEERCTRVGSYEIYKSYKELQRVIMSYWEL